MSINDIKFRDKLLRFVQKKYGGKGLSKFFYRFLKVRSQIFQFILEKGNIRQSSTSDFLALTAFMSELLKQVRIADDKPLVVMVSPVCELLGMCLGEDSKEEEVVCACTQV